MLPPHFCLRQRKVDKSNLTIRSDMYQIKRENVWQRIKLDIYKMVEMNKVINIETMKQEIEDNKMTRNRLKEEDNTEANLYQMAILNKVSRDDIKPEQMIHWSILSNLIKYIDGSSSSDMIPSLTMKPLDYQ